MTVPTRLILPTDTLTPDPKETAARLKLGPSDAVEREAGRPLDDAIASALARLIPHVRAVCSFVTVPITVADAAVDLGFGPIPSRALAKHLARCREAAVFALTLGTGVDRHLLRLSGTSPAMQFLTDGLASAMAEAACDRAEEQIVGNRPHRSRFSPGYGDFPLSVQQEVLAMTDAGRRLGITLNPALLMSPSKSVTAVIGLLPEEGA